MGACGTTRSELASSSVTNWAQAHAIQVPPVDQPYADSSFGFLDSLVGSARILALGELIHRGHEPLEFRNEVIRYAVTHLGFTAVALESGFTESRRGRQLHSRRSRATSTVCFTPGLQLELFDTPRES